MHEDGIFIGSQQLIFDSLPLKTVETASYCNIGVISFHNFRNFFLKFPEIRHIMTDEIIWNPYDTMRDKFLQYCRKQIPYLASAGEITLRKLYYKSNQKLYGPS